MKTIILLFSLVFTAQTSFAQAEPTKSDLEIIIRAVAEQYAKSAAQDLAIKQLQAQAAKAFGEHMAAQLGNAAFNIISAVGLVQSIQSYDEAKTEGSKYSAAAHTAANAISMAFAPIPIVGLMANLVVIGQDLTAAFVSKDSILEQARMIAEINRIYRETSDIQIKQYRAELKIMTTLTERLTAITLLSDAALKQHESNCLKDDFDFKTPNACLTSSLTLEQLALKQLNTIGLILNFNGRFLNFQSLEVNTKDLQLQYKKFKSLQIEISSSIRSALNQVVFNRLWEMRDQNDKHMVFRRCEVSLITKLKQLLIGKKEILQSQEDNIWQAAGVEEKRQEIKILLDGVCLDYFRTAPANIKEIVTSSVL